jgi:hypothetical protein
MDRRHGRPQGSAGRRWQQGQDGKNGRTLAGWEGPRFRPALDTGADGTHGLAARPEWKVLAAELEPSDTSHEISAFHLAISLSLFQP